MCLFNGGQVAIPVVPTVRVVITFTKFVELQPIEQFYTPASSPGQFVNGGRSFEEDENTDSSTNSSSYLSASSSSFSWLSSSSSSRTCSLAKKQQNVCNGGQQGDPFAIPSGYSWSRVDEKSRKMKKSKSTRRAN